MSLTIPIDLTYPVEDGDVDRLSAALDGTGVRCLNADRHDPGLFALAVEVVSRGSEDDDRIVKPRLYARAGIAEYWIADRHPDDPRDAVIDRFVLAGEGDGGGYVQRDQVSLTALEATPGL